MMGLTVKSSFDFVREYCDATLYLLQAKVNKTEGNCQVLSDSSPHVLSWFSLLSKPAAFIPSVAGRIPTPPSFCLVCSSHTVFPQTSDSFPPLEFSVLLLSGICGHRALLIT